MAGCNSIPADRLEQCKAALAQAWPGLRILRVRVNVMDWNRGPRDFEFAGMVHMQCTVSGPEPLLVEHGLVTADELASAPPCGQCRRNGRHIHRGRTRTRVEMYGSDTLHGYNTELDAEHDSIMGLIAAVLVPALWYRPPQTA